MAPSRPAGTASAGRQEAGSWGLILAVLLLPVGLGTAGMAALAKPLFPAVATILAWMLARRSPGRYLSFVICLVVLSPGLRHYVDWHAGYSQSNPIMLAPYAAILAGAPWSLLYLLNGRRYAASSALLLALTGMGVWIAVITGAFRPPVMTAMYWTCPILLATYIWSRAAALTQMRAAVIATVRILVPAVSIYGLVQFIDILPWDAYFMQMAPINSIGKPLPYMVRVFATMNHSGSLAAFLATGILLLLPRIRGWEFISILLAVCTLFVTTQRAATAGFVLAVLVLAATGHSRTVRRSLRKLIVAVAAAVAIAVAVPGIGDKLFRNLESVTQLEEDGSAQERLAQYADFTARLEARPFGSGLAWATNTAQNRDGAEVPLDSGLIDILVGLGVPGGLAFLAILVSLLAQGWVVAIRSPEPPAKAELGVVIFGLAQMPFAVQHAGEHGIFLFLGIGLLLARRCMPAALAGQAAARSRRRRRLSMLAGPPRPADLAGAGATAVR